MPPFAVTCRSQCICISDIPSNIVFMTCNTIASITYPTTTITHPSKVLLRIPTRARHRVRMEWNASGHVGRKKTFLAPTKASHRSSIGRAADIAVPRLTNLWSTRKSNQRKRRHTAITRHRSIQRSTHCPHTTSVSYECPLTSITHITLHPHQTPFLPVVRKWLTRRNARDCD